ncbi:LysR family transcriptional regulator [Roseospira marina]|uniref:LysR family transcriptional regulator n=1 Tax=Roseospira marina TaxID=140057 RepID=A0A5M6IF73_9PROT|nr:LysR family transcriptional regulator [Roseospira marina]KAA5606218.1 LysR family transcriptional regulator [Roseospira marina]MBB4314368.1 LysR family nitrogen assimilation transcriptional regulator [Roseospira marina]MBB5087528.1 LysR family nitrogen assimilation transcriptional regulator [Roseospira marina]
MDPRHLRHLLAVLEAGSVSGAARALGMGQPALSQSLRALEEDLGAVLLHRRPRGVVPTEEGRLLAERARRLLAEWDGLADSLRAAAAEPAGVLAIGVPTSLGHAVSVPVAEALADRFPRVRPRLVEGLSGHIIAWLNAGDLDLGLIFNTEDSADLAVERLAEEHLCLVSAPEARPHGPSITLAEVAARPLILPGRPHGLRAEVERAFAALGPGRTPHVVMEIDALDHIVTLVARGRGDAILSPRVARTALGTGRIVATPIVAPTITRTIGLAHSRLRPPSIALRHALPALAPLIRRLVRTAAEGIERA